MPVLKRGTILTRRLVTTGPANSFTDAGMRVIGQRYEGKLKPDDGGPIPYSTIYRVGVGDFVRFTGRTRAVNVKPWRTLRSDK